VQANSPLNDNILEFRTGFLANFYEGKIKNGVFYTGKPYGSMYDKISIESNHPTIEKDKVLFVGDSARTDVLGARLNGHDIVYVTHGVDYDALLRTSNNGERLEPRDIEKLCDKVAGKVGSLEFLPTFAIDVFRYKLDESDF
jgi:ribonucleotide monophosphatase NagD (HAD superfamily)